MKFKQSQFVLALVLKWYVPIKNIMLVPLLVWMAGNALYCHAVMLLLFLHEDCNCGSHNINVNPNVNRMEAFAQVVH